MLMRGKSRLTVERHPKSQVVSDRIGSAMSDARQASTAAVTDRLKVKVTFPASQRLAGHRHGRAIWHAVLPKTFEGRPAHRYDRGQNSESRFPRNTPPESRTPNKSVARHNRQPITLR